MTGHTRHALTWHKHVRSPNCFFVVVVSAGWCCLVCVSLQRSVQTSRGGAKPLLVTLLKAVGDLFVATQQAACLDMLATITEVFGEVKSAPELAAAQQQALEGGWALQTAALCESCQPHAPPFHAALP